MLWADLQLVGRRTTRGRLGRCDPCATLLLDRNRCPIDGGNGDGWGRLARTLSGDDGMSYGFTVDGENLAPASPRGGGGTGAAVAPRVGIVGGTGERTIPRSAQGGYPPSPTRRAYSAGTRTVQRWCTPRDVREGESTSASRTVSRKKKWVVRGQVKG